MSGDGAEFKRVAASAASILYQVNPLTNCRETDRMVVGVVLVGCFDAFFGCFVTIQIDIAGLCVFLVFNSGALD